MCLNPDSPKIEAVETWHCGQVKLSLRASQVRVAPACSSLVPRTCSVAWETCPKASLEPQSITRQWNSTSNLVTSVSLVLLFKVIITTHSLTTVTMVSSCRVPHHSGPPATSEVDKEGINITILITRQWNLMRAQWLLKVTQLGNQGRIQSLSLHPTLIVTMPQTCSHLPPQFYPTRNKSNETENLQYIMLSLDYWVESCISLWFGLCGFPPVSWEWR